MAVKPIPEGYHQVTPYLIVDGAAAAIDFYCNVLGAKQRGDRLEGPDGKIGHAELDLGDSVIMLSDEYLEGDYRSPKAVGGTPVFIHVYLDDVDAVFARAVAAGATVRRPVVDQFYGDRSGEFEDPFGHRWNVSTHVEDVEPDEMARRAEAAAASGG